MVADFFFNDNTKIMILRKTILNQWKIYKISHRNNKLQVHNFENRILIKIISDNDFFLCAFINIP